jgi:anti-sigma regulatory factor (Ser/Thr protein kinase)
VTGDGSSFSAHYPATAGAPALARAAVLAFARRHRASSQLQSALALAISEAVTNVVVHAYRDRAESGSVVVRAAVAADDLLVTVADSGSGLRARSDSPGLGLGLAIIAESTDGLDLRPVAGGGLEMTMRFSLTEA